MKPISLDKQLSTITNIIEFLRREEASESIPVFLEISGLELTPELEVDLNCVGLAGHQTEDGCLITWSTDIESAKNSYEAEAEYESLRKSGPTED